MKTAIKTHKAVPETCTEFELHAYVDGELASSEQGNVIAAAQQSAEIRAKLNELKTLKELIRYSYHNQM